MRRFGSIRRLPSGRYQARIRPSGAPSLTAPHTFDSEAQATAWLDSMERERALTANFDALGLPRPQAQEGAHPQEAGPYA